MHPGPGGSWLSHSRPRPGKKWFDEFLANFRCHHEKTLIQQYFEQLAPCPVFLYLFVLLQVQLEKVLVDLTSGFDRGILITPRGPFVIEA
jgi:hypothetical protein